MKRVAIKRSHTGLRRTPLKRSSKSLAKTPTHGRTSTLRPRSPRMSAIYDGPGGRAAFVKAFLEMNPHCEVKWKGCTDWSKHVHEWWSRGTGGAIIPGDKADRQCQRFVAICPECHRELDTQPTRAKKEGWVQGIGALQTD